MTGLSHRTISAATLGLWALFGGACTESAIVPITLDLHAQGGPSEVTLADGTRLVLERGALAFGPFYLCAGAQAGQTCQTALAEWREAAVVDLLDPGPRRVGSVEGYSGRALSYMHDCGVVSLLTTETPLMLEAAEELGGRSVEIEGRAEPSQAGAPTIPFRITVTMTSSGADRGQPVVRSGPGAFDATLDEQAASVTAAFDATAWLVGLDSGAFFQDEICSEGGPAVVCAGATSQDCQSGESQDCTLTGQICAPNQGCRDELVFDDASEVGRSVAQAITLTAGLELEVD